MRLFAIAGVLGLCLVAATAYVDCRSTRRDPVHLPRKPPPELRLQGDIAVAPDNWQISTGEGNNEAHGK